MTKKRFTGEFDKQYGGVYDNGEQLTNFEVVDLLNEFDEKYIDELNLRETLQQELRRVENENEQLKQIVGFLKNDNAEDILNVLNSQENRIWKLKQENEQLKQQLKSKERLIGAYEQFINDLKEDGVLDD